MACHVVERPEGVWTPRSVRNLARAFAGASGDDYLAALGETQRSAAKQDYITRQPVYSEQPQYSSSNQQSTRSTISQDSFIDRLIQSESSGNCQAEITIKDGRRFVGKLQFGAARLADYSAASVKRFTQGNFQADPSLQNQVAVWHFNDINKAIDALGDAAARYDRDGLRAAAHLSGKGGMKRFVKSGGKYNPSDELGTSLKDYYNKFSKS